MRVALGLSSLLLLLAAGCSQDDGAEVRNIGESDVSTAVSSGSGSGSSSGSTAASGSSSEAAETPAFTEAEATSTLEYTLVDYKFEGPTEAVGPKVLFTAENTGTQTHELEILDSEGEALGEIEEFAPGADADPLAVELAPGTYTLQCILENDKGEVHKDLGMVATLTVT